MEGGIFVGEKMGKGSGLVKCCGKDTGKREGHERTNRDNRQTHIPSLNQVRPSPRLVRITTSEARPAMGSGEVAI